MTTLAKTLRRPAALSVGLTFIVGSVFAADPPPEPPKPPKPPHFKCYQLAKKGGAINEPVTLKDQFHTEDVDVKNPHFLCGPVEKKHCTKDNYERGCDIYPAEFNDWHLLCWKIAPSGPPVGEKVTARGSQFVKDPTVKVQTGQLLCEPVIKERKKH